MRDLSDAEKKQLWDEVKKEFPDDEAMQQVHYVRLHHHLQTKGMSPAEHRRFFKRRKQPVKA